MKADKFGKLWLEWSQGFEFADSSWPKERISKFTTVMVLKEGFIYICKYIYTPLFVVLRSKIVVYLKTKQKRLPTCLHDLNTCYFLLYSLVLFKCNSTSPFSSSCLLFPSSDCKLHLPYVEQTWEQARKTLWSFFALCLFGSISGPIGKPRCSD